MKLKLFFRSKHLSHFWKTLNIPLINCEIELILTWSKNCGLANMIVRATRNKDDPPTTVAPTGLEFQITGTRLYVPMFHLSLCQQKMTRSF